MKLFINHTKKCMVLFILLIFLFLNFAPVINSLKTTNEIKINATGFFRVEEIDGVWWYINPNGEKFFAIGCTAVDPSDFYYGDLEDWTQGTGENLSKWGFNAITTNYEDYFEDWPFVKRFSFKKIEGIYQVRWHSYRFPDVFDPVWQDAVKNITLEGTKKYRDNRWLLGYELGNELKVGPDYDDEKTFLEFYLDANQSTHGKQEVVRFLRDERYHNNTNLFNRVWNMNIQNFSELLNINELGVKKAYRFRTNIGKILLKIRYPKLRNETIFNHAKKDITTFCKHVAHYYFNITNYYLKQADPNHLNLGVRFHKYGAPEELIEECAKHMDVMSINYYRYNSKVYDPDAYWNCKKYGMVLMDEWLKKYYEIGEIPLRICEYSFGSNDGSWPQQGAGTLVTSGLYRTQRERAEKYDWYGTNCQNTPYLVGQGFWFIYGDKLNKNTGIVDYWDNPYEFLVERMTETNAMAYENHENALLNNVNKGKTLSLFQLKNENIFKIFEKISFPSHMINDNAIFLNENFDLKKSYEKTSHQNTISKNSYKTIYVDNDSNCPGAGSEIYPYCKIQYAIENASDGDTIIVKEGTYSENNIINKSIVLKGEGLDKTLIDGGYKDSISFVITQDNVTLSGFNISSLVGSYYLKNVDYRASSGVLIYNCSNVRITDNLLYKPGGWGGGFGVKVLSCENITIYNNIFKGTHSIRDIGIVMDYSFNSKLANNVFIEQGLTGIWLSTSKYNFINNNEMLDGDVFGILLIKSDENIINDNTLKNVKQKAIVLRNSNNNLIESNNFFKNNLLEFFSYKHATFFNSFDNSWQENYWGRPNFPPKIIIGKTGPDNLITTYDFDLRSKLIPN